MIDDVHAFVRQVWATRHRVELDASVRFGALAEKMASEGAPEAIVSLAERASRDELRHAQRCQTVVTTYGGPTLDGSSSLVEYAPSTLDASMRLLYEIVAQCCVAETESMSTLMLLRGAVRSDELRVLVHELARDEVDHSRLGWAYLAWAQPRVDVAQLAAYIPAMLEGNASNGIFGVARAIEDADELLAHGVVPARVRRTTYVETLESVIFPGLESLGVSTAPARAWLAGKLES